MKINKKFLTIILGILFLSGIIFSSYLFYLGIKMDDIIKFAGNNLFIFAGLTLFIFSIRLFLFIPASVIIIALGNISDNFFLIFLLSLIGSFIGVMQCYYIGILLNKDLEGNKTVKKIEPYISKIKKNGFIYILFGSIIPFFPVDLLYYAAGFEKYDVKKFMLAGIIGITPLVFIYAYLGMDLKFF